MATEQCEWVVIDDECYVPCLNSITCDVDKDTAICFDYCPFCGGEFDLRTDKKSKQDAMHAMKLEHDKEVMEEEVEAEIQQRQQEQVKLFEELLRRSNKKVLTNRK